MIIAQRAELEIFDPVTAMKKLEKIGRVCYRSEDKITDESYKCLSVRQSARSDTGHNSTIQKGTESRTAQV